MRYAIGIDIRLCVGCMTCVAACKTENQVPDGKRRVWVTETEDESATPPRVDFHSQRCNHCDNAPCIPVCPTGASKRRPDGIVFVEQKDCIGCEACVEACPYGARFMHPDGFASKCTYCAHLVDQGLEPACVASCPVDCMVFGDLDDPKSRLSEMVRTRPHHVLLAEKGTKPRGLYFT
ncbi:MAG: 4Fe-4S dicluster domain-containing protein [Gemmatimonadetes bacterium]|nr:4Fe-4S dicluster domain-containing protein [Gemmatimonadota bacterium]